MKDLLNSLSVGTNLSSALIVVATFLILWALQIDNWLNISFAVVIGLLVGIVIGRSTEYYTSQSYRPTQLLAESGKRARPRSSSPVSDWVWCPPPSL